MSGDNPARFVDSSTCVDRLCFMLNSLISGPVIFEFQIELFNSEVPLLQ